MEYVLQRFFISSIWNMQKDWTIKIFKEAQCYKETFFPWASNFIILLHCSFINITNNFFSVSLVSFFDLYIKIYFIV